MPRIPGVIYRDKIWYDTGFIEPGQGIDHTNMVRLFGRKNIGEYTKTNIQVAGTLHNDHGCCIRSIGVRLIGKTREEENLLLDHLRVTLTLGDMPQFDIMGPHASTLRHMFSKEELERLEIDNAPIFERMGYMLKKPIEVPHRQNLSVQVMAAETLPEAVSFRVCLFGYIEEPYRNERH